MGDGGGEPRESVLDALLEVERRIDAEIEQAEAEAERIVAEARREIESGGRAEGEELEQERADLRASLEAELAGAVREIEERAAREAERYASVDEVEVERLGGWLARRIAGGESAG